MRDVRKSFGPKVIYRGLDLRVEEGETHVVIGRSGEGKSVLLKHICGLLAPDSGVVEVEGCPVDAHKPKSLRFIRDRVTMVFQMGALFDSMTVRKNVGFYLDQQKNKPQAEIDQLCEKLLEEVNLPNTGHLLPSELSGGMRKRVGLARALAVEPRIILYDEPTTGLDPVTSQVINELIVKTRDLHAVTSIVVTHDMKSAMYVGDRISMLYEGMIIFTGTPGELEDCPDPVVQQFIHGDSDGPITNKEFEGVQRMSQTLINRSQILRKLDELDREE